MQALRNSEKTRILAPTAGQLWEEGKDEKGRYAGGKWGGRYLRAPDIYFRVLQQAGDRLVRLGEVAEVRFGIKTGANDFFYLEVLPYRPVCPCCREVHPEALIKEEEAAYRERGEAPPEGALVAVRNEAGWEGYLEAGSLRPIIKSYREWADDPDRVPSPRLFVYAKGNHSDAYLRHGEETAIPLRTSVGARSPWWKLSPLTPPTAIVPAGVDREYLFLPNQKGFLIDKRLYGLFHVEPVVVRLMNTALFKLSLEVLVRTGLGGGLADFTVYEYKQGLLLNPKLLPDPDAEATDTQVAKILGLNDQERRELLLALEQLIRERVSRANT
ncbi:hypothetical protein [Allomeiothermus silvanus]|uniref:hypothetical protein n=1 Tax=Allomeiothermus silvanus TaxID=52022 RepID=UPI00019E887F|nr:hypothetical protein [Allomeiothermus silvanus]